MGGAFFLFVIAVTALGIRWWSDGAADELAVDDTADDVFELEPSEIIEARRSEESPAATRD